MQSIVSLPSGIGSYGTANTRQIAAAGALTCALAVTVLPALAAQGWGAITGAQNLRQLMSGLTAQLTLPNGQVMRGEYKADGTGMLHAWGADIARTWSVEGDDRVCIAERLERTCFRFERNTSEPALLRGQDVEGGDWIEFRLIGATDGRRTGIVELPGKRPGSKGGAAAPSTDEIAAELSNPNSALASLNFKNQFRTFEGDLPDADSQSSYTLLFQPSLPFPLANGDKVLFRPAIPLLSDQPGFNSSRGRFESNSGIGDIAFDLAYAPKLDGGLLVAYGLIASLPTASNGLGTDRWTLGPELLLGKITKHHVAGIFPNHQWDIAGSGKSRVNLTSIQAFYTYLPGGGWSVGSGPTMTYDWEGDQWTVPLQVNAGKTVVWNGRPWKLSVEVNYYVEKSDAFGPKWMIGVNIAPVVKNGLATLFGSGK